jgi:hypothetical protein
MSTVTPKVVMFTMEISDAPSGTPGEFSTPSADSLVLNQNLLFQAHQENKKLATPSSTT